MHIQSFVKCREYFLEIFPEKIKKYHLSAQVLNNAQGCGNGAVNQGRLRSECSEALLHVSRILSMQGESSHSD
jgi:hypothetical protein